MSLSVIDYPPIPEPATASGEATRVADGMHWLRMPLGGSLGSINVWAMEDGDGWTMADTGIRSAETLDAWRRAATLALADRPVRRAIVTHMHPDHAGMAGWLDTQYGAQLWMTRLEYYTLRTLASDTAAAPRAALDFYRSAGMAEPWLEDYKLRFGAFGRNLYPLPVHFHAIRNHDIIDIGGRDWRVVTGGGHSPEHASLWSPADRLLISGDQILPTISSNVSLHPYEPDADPLGQWLAGLAELRATVPDDVLVCPAHGRPFHGLHARIDHLVAGHEAGLDRLQAMLATPHRAVDVFPALFRRQIADDVTRMLAVGEALAHLACLRARGRATAVRDDRNVTWWQAA